MDLKEFSQKYLELLTGEFAGINLTRILDAEDFYSKQIYDSVYPWEIPEFRKLLQERKRYIDIGFGGGFPLLPLAFISSEISGLKFLGVESKAKKVNVVAQIAERLGLTNVKLVHERFENLLIDQDVVISFKAVSRIAELLPLIKVAEGAKVTVIFYKGPTLEEEEKTWQAKKESSFWKKSFFQEYELPKDNDYRNIIAFENVPHGTNYKIKGKDLVKLSKIF